MRVFYSYRITEMMVKGYNYAEIKPLLILIIMYVRKIFNCKFNSTMQCMVELPEMSVELRQWLGLGLHKLRPWLGLELQKPRPWFYLSIFQ